ncbi:MAG: hypothetical protein EP333_00655 [Bacteroidetes bacterium]|nr:MAG: hypothetical protein EP333_00655 [Bacteroidota bacterium]TNE99155.1 MAG: hypothetical protein EP322_03720 [Bacteroidota bacterium]
MKRTLLTFSAILSMTLSYAQTQIGNAGFENWEAVGSDQEPVNWNSFMNAQGNFSAFASNQIAPSTDVRPGSTGTKSCRIWSNEINVIFTTVVANGNVTLGRINMDSSTPDDPSNYNFTKVGDANFSEAMTDTPDSLVFWVKFTPNGHTENARVKATLHDDNSYRDPEDAASSNYVVATAELNYGSTGGNWVRKSIPFTYSGPASTPAYILVTFTTNQTPGGGAGDDEVLIDDVELIYNPAGVGEISSSEVTCFVNNEEKVLVFNSNKPFEGTYEIYSLSGALVQNGVINGPVSIGELTGTFLVKYTVDGINQFQKIFVH